MQIRTATEQNHLRHRFKGEVSVTGSFRPGLAATEHSKSKNRPAGRDLLGEQNPGSRRDWSLLSWGWAARPGWQASAPGPPRQPSVPLRTCRSDLCRGTDSSERCLRLGLGVELLEKGRVQASTLKGPILGGP